MERQLINPKYYGKLSEILSDLAKERKRGVIDYQELLERYKDIASKVCHPEEDESYPESVRPSAALRALYDNCGCDERLTHKLDNAIRGSLVHGWRDDPVKQKAVKRELFKLLGDEEAVEHVFAIAREQQEY